MIETLLAAALNRRNTGRPPVWMMRQAGRYHSHYQSLKRYNDFLALCKDPQLAAETALGPIHDFNFDAAILFSDLLFPLEAMGMEVGLTRERVGLLVTQAFARLQTALAGFAEVLADADYERSQQVARQPPGAGPSGFQESDARPSGCAAASACSWSRVTTAE